MSINFSTLQGLRIPEGNVVEIKDASGRVLWAVQSNKPAILEVKKITSDTYAGETTYTGEEFILLDIYPKTNGTVSVTYGGLTKTITDTSGAAEPNAQQVFFGTFNGVSDVVGTPANGTLTIEGDFYGFGEGVYYTSSKSSSDEYCACVTLIVEFSKVTIIPPSAFRGALNMDVLEIPDTVLTIGENAFFGVPTLQTLIIGKGVTSIGYSIVDTGAENVLTTIRMLGTTPPELVASPVGVYAFGVTSAPNFNITEITVPKGCVSVYKNPPGWDVYKDLIVEASE